MFKTFFRSYTELPKNIILLFATELCLSLVHVAFILILNIYLRKEGYSDPDIASFNSLRFIGAFIFSLPLGIYIRGKQLKPLLKDENSFIYLKTMVFIDLIFALASKLVLLKLLKSKLIFLTGNFLGVLLYLYLHPYNCISEYIIFLYINIYSYTVWW